MIVSFEKENLPAPRGSGRRSRAPPPALASPHSRGGGWPLVTRSHRVPPHLRNVFRVESLEQGFGTGLRVESSGCRIEGLGFRIY